MQIHKKKIGLFLAVVLVAGSVAALTLSSTTSNALAASHQKTSHTIKVKNRPAHKVKSLPTPTTTPAPTPTTTTAPAPSPAPAATTTAPPAPTTTTTQAPAAPAAPPTPAPNLGTPGFQQANAASITWAIGVVEAAGLEPAPNWTWSMANVANPWGITSGYFSDPAITTVFAESNFPVIAVVSHEIANSVALYAGLYSTTVSATPTSAWLASFTATAAAGGGDFSPTDSLSVCMQAHIGVTTLGAGSYSGGSFRCTSTLANTVWDHEMTDEASAPAAKAAWDAAKSAPAPTTMTAPAVPVVPACSVEHISAPAGISITLTITATTTAIHATVPEPTGGTWDATIPAGGSATRSWTAPWPAGGETATVCGSGMSWSTSATA